MTIARKNIINAARSDCYHLTSRCVRRAFLCGDGYQHRRDWIAELVEQASKLFAVEILGFAIMSNHFRLVVKTHPQWPDTWDDLSVARRWAALFPHRHRDGSTEAWSLPEIQALAQNTDCLSTTR